jgi:hypothetical protein
MKKLAEARSHGFKSVILDRWIKKGIEPTATELHVMLERLQEWETEEKIK